VSTLVAQRRWAEALAEIDLIDKALAGQPAHPAGQLDDDHRGDFRRPAAAGRRVGARGR